MAIHDYELPSPTDRGVDQRRHRLDDQRGSERDRKVGLGKRVVRPSQQGVVQILPIEDDVRLDDPSALRAFGDGSAFYRGIDLIKRIGGSAGGAMVMGRAAVELVHLPAARPGVKHIDVLGVQAVKFSRLFKLSQSDVDDRGLEVGEIVPLILRPGVEDLRIPFKERKGDDLLDAEVFVLF